MRLIVKFFLFTFFVHKTTPNIPPHSPYSSNRSNTINQFKAPQSYDKRKRQGYIHLNFMKESSIEVS